MSDHLNSVVRIRTTAGVTLKGTLKAYDDHLNLVLGATSCVRSEGISESVGLCVVRGNNIEAIEVLEHHGIDEKPQKSFYRKIDVMVIPFTR